MNRVGIDSCVAVSRRVLRTTTRCSTRQARRKVTDQRPGKFLLDLGARQHVFVSIAAQHCRLGLFQDSDFAGYFEDSKSFSDAFPSIFGSGILFQ